MRTDFLRLVYYQVGEDEKTGIFHRWIQKRDDSILALIEGQDGRMLFLAPDTIRFLGYHESKEYWFEIENRPLM